MDCVNSALLNATKDNAGLAAFINSANDALKAIRKTPYHCVVGRDFLHHVDDVSAFLKSFHRQASAKKPNKAIYCEMNGFSNNTSNWHFNAFGFSKLGSLEGFEWDWLAYWDSETPRFTLTGMENVQKAFAKWYRDANKPLYVAMAEELAECLVIARFMELIAMAHQKLKRTRTPRIRIPLLATSHGRDTISVRE